MLDLESTTNELDCRVWAWGICEIGNESNHFIGTNIDTLMEWCKKQPDNPIVYIHNLRWDSQFIMYWLFHNDFKHVTSEERASNTFTTIINTKGLYYAIEIIFYLNGKKVKKVTFQDSHKLLPMSVEEIAEAFKLPFKKLELDYDCHNDRPVDAPLTADEKQYLLNDLFIPSYALNYLFSQGLTRMTIGSCALFEYKSLIGKNNFKRYFPTLKCHEDIRQCYKGGYVYVNPRYSEKLIKNGFVLDKNSMFSWVMKTKTLPWGTPIFFQGEYKPDKLYPLYIQMFRCQFELKPGKLPMVQIKNSIYFTGTEYLTSSDNQELTLCMTNVDLALFLDHYDVYNMEYLSGWKFQGKKGLFDVYIDKWSANKIQARAEDNPGLEFIAKRFLNSLYGKFGTSNKLEEKAPYLNKETDTVCFRKTKPVEKDGIYIPMAAFITSYARDEMVRSAQKIEDDYISGKSKIRFLYCDTDSLHCASDDFSLPEGLHIDRFELGAWKYESKFKRAKFLRTKCYIEDSTKEVDSNNPEWEIKVTVAGMPKECCKQVTFKNFKFGATYHGKKQPKAVKGGVILETIDFTLKR